MVEFVCNPFSLGSPSSGVASCKPRLGGEPPWSQLISFICRFTFGLKGWRRDRSPKVVSKNAESAPLC